MKCAHGTKNTRLQAGLTSARPHFGQATHAIATDGTMQAPDSTTLAIYSLTSSTSQSAKPLVLT
eukprot:CAMPEP_0175744120 /NCGR_PEP_ID=MMETSP0097-20121207/57382_1 /TAXON_ID=311494 /ORGANISM="Alexandrium monilatum, Strain CCMP3105" /LENGTH=63 /DNA_ID=CAMNT_0017052457 /DNA_START=21 /DNA_END=208 /DNA_ORIENTATION=+